ncbi:MAG: squalene/phytoene synthase family protein [Gemmatimonadota bacterium]
MADLQELLQKTSRTFALSIPLLPEPTRDEVTIAYLLFRIADTFEDSVLWPRSERVRALRDLRALLEEIDPPGARETAKRWVSRTPIRHDGYLELLRETPFVLRCFADLGTEAQAVIRTHIARTIDGMAEFVARTDEDGMLRLHSLRDLRGYCYTVAGIVGEMCTELFLIGRDELEPVATYLRERATTFGEGLQLVNILKDSRSDAREGRLYLPPEVERDEIFDLARRDLMAATQYTLALQRAGASRGLVAFNALPVEMAWATLRKVERKGPGAKITRPEVWAIVARVESALATGQPAARVPEAQRASLRTFS